MVEEVVVKKVGVSIDDKGLGYEVDLVIRVRVELRGSLARLLDELRENEAGQERVLWALGNAYACIEGRIKRKYGENYVVADDRICYKEGILKKREKCVDSMEYDIMRIIRSLEDGIERRMKEERSKLACKILARIADSTRSLLTLFCGAGE